MGGRRPVACKDALATSWRDVTMARGCAGSLPLSTLTRLGFGGGCHWCTEAIFEALIGVERVEQGWVASVGDDAEPSEAVIAHFDARIIDLDTLVRVHLCTHSSTSVHALRDRYRSAIYTFTDAQAAAARAAMEAAQGDFDRPLITRVLPFAAFVPNEARYLGYYRNAPDLPFCQTHITPKLRRVTERLPDRVKPGFVR